MPTFFGQMIVVVAVAAFERIAGGQFSAGRGEPSPSFSALVAIFTVVMHLLARDTRRVGDRCGCGDRAFHRNRFPRGSDS